MYPFYVFSLSRRKWAVAVAALSLGAGLPAFAQSPGAMTTQAIALRQGWNAVSIQLDPLLRDAGVVFTNLPVDRVATYFPTRTPVEFIQDPASQPWKQPGWRVWFAPSLSEAAVNDLYAVVGGQCYLIHATAAATLNVVGTVIAPRVRWRADSFNFVGFPIDPANPPTFQAWFAGSSAHQSSARPLFYTLDGSGRWQAVTHPESTLIQPNTAYWVFCQGASDYQGPLTVTTLVGALGAQVDFGDVSETVALNLVNKLTVPLGVSMEFTSTNALPISYLQPLLALGTTLQVPLTAPTDLGKMEAGGSQAVRLLLDRASMSQTNDAGVLTIRDDVGSLLRIPVTASLP